MLKLKEIMRLKIIIIVVILLNVMVVKAQESSSPKAKIAAFELQKKQEERAERLALKEKVNSINKRIEDKDISIKIADSLKRRAAIFHALNIENRIDIIDSNISLLKRNNGLIIDVQTNNRGRLEMGLGQKNEDGERLFGIIHKSKNKKKFHYDKRTSSDLILSAGLNSIVGGDNKFLDIFNLQGHYYEVGWNWRYRINKKNNKLRLNFGVVYHRNILKSNLPLLFQLIEDGDSSIAVDGGDALNEEDYKNLNIIDSQLSFGNIVLPIHIELGSSKSRKNERSIRYSIKRKFRIGFGGYLGVNMHKSQRLKYARESSKGFNRTSVLHLGNDTVVYGLSGYIGVGGILLYTKYDLSSMFEIEDKKYNNFSLGFRFDL